MIFPFSFMKTGGYDPDAQAFFDRVTTAGGTLSTTEKLATNQLVLDMKSAGIWTSMRAVYPMVGASAAACAQNLKSSSFTGTFSSGWTFASTGVKPNATSAFFNTGLIASAQLVANSSHLSYYSRTNSTVGVEIGSWNTAYASGSELALNRGSGNIGTYAFINSSGLQEFKVVTATPLNSQAFVISSRTASNLLKLYRNSSLVATNTVINVSGLSAFNTYIGAANDFGTAGAFSNKECALASIGDGLTDTEASNFYTAVQAFQTTLSRQIAP